MQLAGHCLSFSKYTHQLCINSTSFELYGDFHAHQKGLRGKNAILANRLVGNGVNQAPKAQFHRVN
jgi:hypothetical protein